ncbi:M28 family peptidase [Halalkalirubrum salinum]|uniref:M28 family peptidase n=1 Tax=Halalkalirubrum salinum TaxID=2563889 RepID=UPI0010FB04EE|nr:M28 family peptidase [Halalkalirubrum salinum]
MFTPIDRTTEINLQDEIDPANLEAHVTRFSGLHRYPATDDQWEAAEYIVDELSASGVEVEMQTVEAYTSVPESACVTVTSPVTKDFDDAITTAFSVSTPTGGVSGKVVFVDSIDHNPIDLAHVENKIVFTRGLPTPAPVQTLEEAGAKAVIFQSPGEHTVHDMIVSPVWGNPSVDDVAELPNIPIAEIHHEDGEWLAEQIFGDAVEVTVEAQTRTKQRELPCPIARVEGTESDRYVVVGNHIDSWYEGVTDNGTAIAASMELARIFAENPPKRGLVVGFWPGHSMGRYAGSARYADENWLDLRNNGVAYLHLDLNGLDGADQLWFQHMAEVEDEHFDILEDASLPLGTEGGDGDLIGTTDRPGRNSDQSFWGTGLSSLLSGARFGADNEAGGPIGGGWWWHTPEDTLDKVDFEVLSEEMELYTAIISRFCNSVVLPHDFRKTAAEIRSVVEELDAAAEGRADFTPVYTRLDSLESSLDEFTAIVNDVEQDEIVDRIEDVQVELGNKLIPALYMEAPEYEHDPALPHKLLPYLRLAATLPDRSGPRRGFAQTKVTRSISKLAHRIEEATTVVQSFVISQ